MPKNTLFIETIVFGTSQTFFFFFSIHGTSQTYSTKKKETSAHNLKLSKIGIFSCFCEHFSLLTLDAFVYCMYQVGWGSFHMGFSNNDPEPGRCRRTDGKKWRCSRDAVADQKYCERHMNRGRHRSRKPVEGQTGHAITGTTTTTNNNASSTSSKLMPIASSPSGAVVVAPGGGRSAATNSLAHQQLKNLQPGGSNPSVATTISR